MTAGTFAELLQLKGRFDDLFEAVLEENAALRGKLAEARVRTVTVENRYVPVPRKDESLKKKTDKKQLTENSLAKALENLNFEAPIPVPKSHKDTSKNKFKEKEKEKGKPVLTGKPKPKE